MAIMSIVSTRLCSTRLGRCCGLRVRCCFHCLLLLAWEIACLGQSAGQQIANLQIGCN
jgi:hypothetical protein